MTMTGQPLPELKDLVELIGSVPGQHDVRPGTRGLLALQSRQHGGAVVSHAVDRALVQDNFVSRVIDQPVLLCLSL